MWIPFCDSHRIQTYNLLIRSQMLYSVELASHALEIVCFSFASAKVGVYSVIAKGIAKNYRLLFNFFLSCSAIAH